MFKVKITEEYTEMEGKTSELLAGLGCYVEALKRHGIPKILIEKAVKFGLEDSKEDKVETILDNDRMKVQKFDLNGLSKEEVKELFNKELFNKLFD